MFNPGQSSSFMGGLALISEASETITSQSTDLSLMIESGFDYLPQFERLNGSNLTTFDLSGQGDSPVCRMLGPANFHSSSEALMRDFSTYGNSVMPTILYDPAVVRMNVNLEDGFNPEYDFYGGQFENCEKACTKKKAMMMRGLEEFGTQKNEKQRRERLGKKFEQLKSLIPNPTKPDRATIVSDTIDHIKELLRTVDELKILIGKKRSKNVRSIKLEIQNEIHCDMESSSIKPNIDESDHGQNGCMRSSWVQRRSKSTFVDVRVIEDEVYIRLEQRKRVDCSLIVSRVLDELQLELSHLSCGNVEDDHIFMISTKTNYEGSQVHASSVAMRFIGAMDG